MSARPILALVLPLALGAVPAGAARAPRPEPTPAPAVEAVRAAASDHGGRAARRRGLGERPSLRRLHPARSRGGPAGDRAHRAAPPLRRRRPLRGGAAPRRRAREDREAPLAPRRERRGRPLLPLPRPPARPSHRRALRGERGRGPERRDHLQRHLDGRLVGRGVALRRPPRRAGLVGGDADPLLRAALPPRRPPDLGRQRLARHPAEERGGLARARAEDRERPRLAHGRAHRHPRREAAHAARPRAVRRGRRRDGPRGRGRPVLRRTARLRQRRPRPPPQGRRELRPRRHAQPGLRPGRGGPGGREPHRLRDLLPGEAPLLRGGGADLRQLRPERREQLLRVHAYGARPLLHAAHRPGPAGGPGDRVRGGPAGHHDPRRRQVHREERVGMERGRPRGGDRARAGVVAGRGRPRAAGGRAPEQLLRPASAPRPVARRLRRARHRGEPRPRRPAPRGADRALRLRRRPRRLRLPRSGEGLGGLRAGGRQPRRRASARRSRGCSSPRPATSSGPTGPSRGSTRPAPRSAAGRAASTSTASRARCG